MLEGGGGSPSNSGPKVWLPTASFPRGLGQGIPACDSTTQRRAETKKAKLDIVAGLVVWCWENQQVSGCTESMTLFPLLSFGVNHQAKKAFQSDKARHQCSGTSSLG